MARPRLTAYATNSPIVPKQCLGLEPLDAALPRLYVEIFVHLNVLYASEDSDVETWHGYVSLLMPQTAQWLPNNDIVLSLSRWAVTCL